LALPVIQRAVPNNNFLTDSHTQGRFLTENWYPNLSERSDAEAWQEAGALDMQARVKQKLRDILD
jgi:trimethylamine--corrinoid protein Co-methyltransferase